MASEKKSCTCAECGKSFVNASNLTRHIRQFHQHDQMLHCVYATCRKSFVRPADLAHHLMSHQGERTGAEVSAVFSPGPASEGSPSPAAPQREPSPTSSQQDTSQSSSSSSSSGGSSSDEEGPKDTPVTWAILDAQERLDREEETAAGDAGPDRVKEKVVRPEPPATETIQTTPKIVMKPRREERKKEETRNERMERELGERRRRRWREARESRQRDRRRREEAEERETEWKKKRREKEEKQREEEKKSQHKKEEEQKKKRKVELQTEEHGEKRKRESASGRERETSPVARASGSASSVTSQERTKQEIERLRRTSALMRQRRRSQGGDTVTSRYSGSTVGGASMVTMGSPVHLVVRSIRNKILLTEEYMEEVVEELYDRD